MKKLTLETSELLARKLRDKLGVGINEPLSMKTVLRQLNVMAVYRPLSEKLFGLSLKSGDGQDMFMLINSNSTRGRQHFTIAHELFHLMYDDEPKPHFCENGSNKASIERSADMFASAFLMPREGIISKISPEEIASREVSAETALRLGQLYGVSHSTLVFRLKELKIISPQHAEKLLGLYVQREAESRGLDLSLYKPGNQGLIIGDFGTKARRLYDSEKISEGHYFELLKMIGYGESKDSAGC